MDFKKWVYDFGIAELAIALGCSPRVVYRWIYGQGWPRIKQILKIVELSKGRLTIEDILKATNSEGYINAKRKR